MDYRRTLARSVSFSALNRTRNLVITAALAAAPFLFGVESLAAAPLHIGFSDWPGYVAWQVAIEKGFLKDAGVDAKFDWFDYSASMDAYSAGKLDAVMVTNGDQLVMGGNGAKSVAIMITDYSNGNDMIVGKPGIKSLADLKGKKVGVEIGLVEHLLLINGLEKAKIPEGDIKLVNTKTNETPQVLASGDVSAVGAWQPIIGQAMKGAPGSRPLYTSAQAPGLIYDVMVVKPESLAENKAEWQKLVSVWDRTLSYIEDAKTQPDAVKIMAARSGVGPNEYVKYLKGTGLIDLKEGKTTMIDEPGLGSLYGSSRNADSFNVKFNVYKTSQDVKTYIDPSITDALGK